MTQEVPTLLYTFTFFVGFLTILAIFSIVKRHAKEGPTGSQGPSGTVGLRGILGEIEILLGPTGVRGLQGIPGKKGIPGKQGARGPPPDWQTNGIITFSTGVPSATITDIGFNDNLLNFTVPPNEEFTLGTSTSIFNSVQLPDVEITDTNNVLNFLFKLPFGNQGPQGPSGDTSTIQGETGPVGFQGESGANNYDAASGATGPQGPPIDSQLVTNYAMNNPRLCSFLFTQNSGVITESVQPLILYPFALGTTFPNNTFYPGWSANATTLAPQSNYQTVIFPAPYAQVPSAGTLDPVFYNAFTTPLSLNSGLLGCYVTGYYKITVLVNATSSNTYGRLALIRAAGCTRSTWGTNECIGIVLVSNLANNNGEISYINGAIPATGFQSSSFIQYFNASNETTQDYLFVTNYTTSDIGLTTTLSINTLQITMEYLGEVI